MIFLSAAIRIDGAQLERREKRGRLLVRGVAQNCGELRVAVHAGGFRWNGKVGVEGAGWQAAIPIPDKHLGDFAAGRPLRLLAQSLADLTEFVLIPGSMSTTGTVVPGAGGIVVPDPDGCNIQIGVARREEGGGQPHIQITGTAAGCSSLLITARGASASNYDTTGATASGSGWRAVLTGLDLPCNDPITIIAQCSTDPTCLASVTTVVECDDGGGGRGPKGTLVGEWSTAPAYPIGGHSLAFHPMATHGTLGALSALLRAVGLSWDGVLNELSMATAEETGGFLDYLHAGSGDGPGSAQRLLFYLRLARGIHPHAQFADWAALLRDLSEGRLSEASERFVRENRVAERLWELLVESSGIQVISEPCERPSTVAFLRSVLRSLEGWTTLAGEDPNLNLLVHIVNRYGTLSEYYRFDPTPRRSIQRLIEGGYDVEHLVFGEEELLERAADDAADDDWITELRGIARRILGNRSEPPVHDLGIDAQKHFQSFRVDYEAMLDREDTALALRVIEALLEPLLARRVQLYRTGALSSEIQINGDIYRLERLRARLSGEDELPAEARVRAVRSSKHVPELLFDNERLACCLFKPAGMFHHEISRLLLDPATPLIEYWLDPHPEFLGLATLYPGFNAAGERAILMDTVDYSDKLLDLHGYNPTMQLLLVSMAIDAYRAGAKKLLIFAAPYGKPVNFASYVRRVQSRHESVRYHESYYFESIDPEDTSLASSLTGKHHYTTALGFDRSMRGTIDFGFNLVGPGRVEKLPTGGRGLFEMDVAAFLLETGSMPEREADERRPAASIEQAVHARPPHHDEEIRRRTDRVALRAGSGSPIDLEIVRELDRDTLEQMLAVESSAFGPHFRYDEQEYLRRWKFKGSTFVLARQGGNLVGQAVAYSDPMQPDGSQFYVDEIAVHPLKQRTGTGTILLNCMLDLARVSGGREVSLMTDRHALASGHHAFYSRAGFWPAGPATAQGQRYVRHVSIHDATEAHREVLDYFRAMLAERLPESTISFVDGFDEDVLDHVRELEREFVPDLRYSAEEVRERMQHPDASVIMFLERDRPVAFGLNYHIPDVGMAFSPLPRHAFFFDSMAVRKDRQNHGLGALMLRASMAFASLGRYTTAVFYCQCDERGKSKLVSYYERSGAEVVGVEEGWATMVIPLVSSPGPSWIPLELEADSGARAG